MVESPALHIGENRFNLRKGRKLPVMRKEFTKWDNNGDTRLFAWFVAGIDSLLCDLFGFWGKNIFSTSSHVSIVNENGF